MKNKSSMLLFVVAAIFIGIGIFRGEVQEVVMKGINLCLECVGIG